jgi:simple sugar transport system permease protein
MQASGINPKFAQASGINVDRMRILGTILSTILGAVGILVYAQGFGFLQLYGAPMYMGFIAAAAILIGGATLRTAKISHVVIGTFLFQGILVVALPVANTVATLGSLAEISRIIVSNGIILYALAQKGGDE